MNKENDLLSRIDRVLQKDTESIEQLYLEVNDKIKSLEESAPSDSQLAELKKRQKELKELLDYEKAKKQLAKEQLQNSVKKQEEEQVTKYFKDAMIGYFEQFPNRRNQVYSLLNNSDVIKDEINNCKEYLKEEYGRVYDLEYDRAYFKAMSEAKKIYSQDIQETNTRSTSSHSKGILSPLTKILIGWNLLLAWAEKKTK